MKLPTKSVGPKATRLANFRNGNGVRVLSHSKFSAKPFWE